MSTSAELRAAGQAARGILARHRVAVIVPLTPHSETDLITATSPSAFGALATSWPPDPVTLAETLVHEFQHIKLCRLLDLVPLAESGGDTVYAPWRRDPRPGAGLLQGVYAHIGIVRSWAAQRHAETGPDDVLRAQVQFARWRPTIAAAVDTLRQTGCLTAQDERFTELMRAEGQRFAGEPVPDDAFQIAREVSLDHWLTWQIQHLGGRRPPTARYRTRLPDPSEDTRSTAMTGFPAPTRPPRSHGLVVESEQVHRPGRDRVASWPWPARKGSAGPAHHRRRHRPRAVGPGGGSRPCAGGSRAPQARRCRVPARRPAAATARGSGHA